MKCSICFGEIEVVGTWAEGHNAEPVNNGRCCGVCNDAVVIPARLRLMFDARKHAAVTKDANTKGGE